MNSGNKTTRPPIGLTPLAIAVGLILAQPALATGYIWSGYYSSSGNPNPLNSPDSLTINTGGGAILDVSLTNNSLIAANDTLSFYGGSLTNNGVYQAQGDVNLINYAYGGTVYNYGSFEKTAGSGTTSLKAASVSSITAAASSRPIPARSALTAAMPLLTPAASSPAPARSMSPLTPASTTLLHPQPQFDRRSFNRRRHRCGNCRH